MYLMGLGATTELPENFERKKKMNVIIVNQNLHGAVTMI